MNNILCENYLCIFQRNDHCTKAAINISDIGLCNTAVTMAPDCLELDSRKAMLQGCETGDEALARQLKMCFREEDDAL